MRRSSSTAPRGRQATRELVRISGRLAGPTLVITAGIHGNEPAGSAAVARVAARIEEQQIPIRGELVALAGNLAALELGRRFVDIDLNRAFLPERVARLRQTAPAADAPAEEHEVHALLREIEAVRARAVGRIYFLDLHTSSADGCPFLTCGDTLRNRRFALAFPAPVLLGIEEQLDGSLLEFMSDEGAVTLGVEGGRHDRESAVDRHESALLIALVEAGLIAVRHLPDLAEHRQRLRAPCRGVPHVVEVRYRHGVSAGDGFSMLPGYHNFQPVRAGELLARSNEGEIRARESGLLLLPLYQGQGSDGFFIGRRVGRGWLALSRLMRRIGLQRLIALLPGVRRHPLLPSTLRVNTAVARWFPLEIFHLLGYRKLRWRKNVLMVSRRRYDGAR